MPQPVFEISIAYNKKHVVVVEKPNRKLRVCLDPRPLNEAIKREHIYHPTAEEISQMSGASYFSKLDASSGSNLLTFGTSSGRYRFERLPYISILQVKFVRGKLLQLFRTYQAVRIPKATS